MTAPPGLTGREIGLSLYNLKVTQAEARVRIYRDRIRAPTSTWGPGSQGQTLMSSACAHAQVHVY